MNRRSFIMFGLAGVIGGHQAGLFGRTPEPGNRNNLKRWQRLVDQSEDPELIGSPRLQARLAARLRRAIAEVDQALLKSPDDTDLHLMLVKLHLADHRDDLFLSERVLRHARRAAVLAPRDPEVLALAGDAISFRGLIHDSIGLWREGVRLLRAAYRLKTTPANRRSLQSALAHAPA